MQVRYLRKLSYIPGFALSLQVHTHVDIVYHLIRREIITERVSFVNF
jgi:hypothetical protein